MTSYKIALLRALNEVVLAYPGMDGTDRPIAVPLRLLAASWIGFYWPFVAAPTPILQGPRALQGSTLRHDMSFRPALTALRTEWERGVGEGSRPADGFFLVQDLRVARKQATYPASLHQAYSAALTAIQRALAQPIRYAGPGEWTIFPRPARGGTLAGTAVAVPGTQAADVCVLLPAALWRTFAVLSLWVEALCIHEWCRFTAGVIQPDGHLADRGTIYRLLMDRPDNRRPLTWERNAIAVLLLEGQTFGCPWTGRRLGPGVPYAADHLMPVALYPINELWNLVPADPTFNSQIKRDRLPSAAALLLATPRLAATYALYAASAALGPALWADVALRFPPLPAGAAFAPGVAGAAANYLAYVAAARNVARFEAQGA